MRDNNRRRHGRVLCDGITCDLGAVVDISASGIQVNVGKLQIPIGADLTFTIHGPDGPIPVRAVALRCEKIGRHYEIGLRFYNLSPQTARDLAIVARIGATKTEKLKD